jgi:hypothetical protein
MRHSSKATPPGTPSRVVPYTAEEEKARDAEEAAAAAQPPETDPPVLSRSELELLKEGIANGSIRR